MDRVFLIRHGESETNAGLPTIHPCQVGLTSVGEEQANRIAEYLTDYPPELIVTSPYQRTKQTAKPILDILRHTVLQDEWTVQEFTYLSPEYFGTSSTPEYRKPLVDAYWEQLLPDWEDGPGSESFESFINKRVLDFLKRLKSAEEEYKTIAVFSHEQFINAVLWIIDCNPSWIRDRNPEICSRTMRQFRTYLNDHPIRNGAIARLTFNYHDDCWRYELITDHLKHETPEAKPPPVKNPILVAAY